MESVSFRDPKKVGWEMSNYQRLTKHPETGEFQMAMWMDNYYGGHLYGVKFPSGKVFRASDYKWEFKDE